VQHINDLQAPLQNEGGSARCVAFRPLVLPIGLGTHKLLPLQQPVGDEFPGPDGARARHGCDRDLLQKE